MTLTVAGLPCFGRQKNRVAKTSLIKTYHSLLYLLFSCLKLTDNVAIKPVVISVPLSSKTIRPDGTRERRDRPYCAH